MATALADVLEAQAKNSPRVVALVAEAVQIHRELRPRHDFKPLDIRPEKLSAKQYKKTALENAGMTEREVRELEKRLARLSSADWPWLSLFRGKVSRIIRAVKENAALIPLASGWSGVLECPQDQVPLLMIECQQNGTNPLQLVALESVLAVDEAKACFGLIDRPWAEHHARVTDLTARWKQIAAQLPDACAWNQDCYGNWIPKEKSVAEVRFIWRGERTYLGIGRADLLDRVVEMAMP
jgi:hypothetical protein